MINLLLFTRVRIPSGSLLSDRLWKGSLMLSSGSKWLKLSLILLEDHHRLVSISLLWFSRCQWSTRCQQFQECQLCRWCRSHYLLINNSISRLWTAVSWIFNSHQLVNLPYLWWEDHAELMKNKLKYYLKIVLLFLKMGKFRKFRKLAFKKEQELYWKSHYSTIKKVIKLRLDICQDGVNYRFWNLKRFQLQLKTRTLLFRLVKC